MTSMINFASSLPAFYRLAPLKTIEACVRSQGVSELSIALLLARASPSNSKSLLCELYCVFFFRCSLVHAKHILLNKGNPSLLLSLTCHASEE